MITEVEAVVGKQAERWIRPDRGEWAVALHSEWAD